MTDKPTPQKATDSSDPAIEAIAKVVADLYIAHRNLSIYPLTHEQVKQSVQKAYAGLSKALERQKSFTLAVMKDGLALDQTRLPANNQICKEFAHILKQHRVATLTFEQELDGSELIRFLLLIGSDQEEVSEQGGIEAAAEACNLSNITLAVIKKIGDLDASPELMPIEGDSGQNELSSEQVSSLLSPEQYDHCVDEDYGILLDDLAAEDQSAPVAESLSEQLAECMVTSNINYHVSRAMIELMAQSPDSEGYRSWARQLSYLLDDLLETQAYDCLAETLAFVRDELDNPDKEKAKIADIVLSHFSGPEFVAKAVERILKVHGDAGERGLQFLVRLGEPVVVEIMDLLSTGETEIDRKNLIQSLDKFGLLAAREAVERLGDSRLNFLRMMIRIVRRLGDRQSADHLRSLLEHADIGIRLEALGTLLRFKNNWGLIRLRELINAPWSDLAKQAIALAGDHKVTEVVSLLVDYAQQRGEAQRQEAAIRALGRIGDARAVPVLDKLARRRWSMSKKHQLRLKQVIFESLDGYAAQDISDLLHFGIKDEDAVIRSNCEKILRKIRMADRS